MSTAAPPDVRYEQRGGVGYVVIDRAPVNAFRTETWEALGDALDAAAGDEGCAVVVLTSGLASGPFCAGADVNELPMTPERDAHRMALVHRMLDRLAHTTVPTIAAIAGACVGSGCALIAACDMRVATADVRFMLREIDVGRCGGARHLMRVLPQGIVRYMAFSGRPIDAALARELGMVLDVARDRVELSEMVDELARTLASKSPVALRTSKRSLDACEELPLAEGYAVEQQFSIELASTADAAEATAAFRQGRDPNWHRRDPNAEPEQEH
ncbi:MAG: enoyl-CoA hydratase/isomerase family protein [Actinobacteria bacterium]|nr:enoyl-CoA hydratase/isomerase family protein [Actinomycetota bacterium]